MEEQVYESRGATSWESRMYSNTSIRLDNYNTRKPYPENIQEIENVIYKNFRRLADKISKDG